MNERDVFINCPFSVDYLEHFRAIVYTIVRSGFTPRCARERDDAGEVRYDKICAIIKDCAFGVHDISRTECDPKTGLPRFNMPFELGLFLGATKFGGRSWRAKRTLIVDRDQYRYQTFLSDIGGQDIHAHGGEVGRLIETLATWLRDHSAGSNVPGGRRIATEFGRLRQALPAIAATKALEDEELTFRDYWAIAADWSVAEAGQR